MDLKNSKNYKLSPGEIVGKVRKKPRHWFKIFLNIIGGLFLLLVVGLGMYRMWAYYSISKMTPKDDVEFYAIFDDRLLEHSENWQGLIRKYIEKDDLLDLTLWDSLLKSNEYYLSIYQKTIDSDFEFLFYIPNLPNTTQSLLKNLDIPFIYNGKFLLLNNTDFYNVEKFTNFFDFNILNRLGLGAYQGDYFIIYEENTKIVVDLPDIKGDGNTYKTYINYLEKKNELYFASNSIKWADVGAYLDFSANLGVDNNNSMELAVYDDEHQVLTRNFTVVLKDLNNTEEVLKNFEYLFAYNNRLIVESELADESMIKEELLDFGKHAWQNENFYKKILIDENLDLYFYAFLRDTDLILSTKISDIEFLQSSTPLNLGNYHFMKSKFITGLGSYFEVMDYCEDWTFNKRSFLQVESCE